MYEWMVASRPSLGLGVWKVWKVCVFASSAAAAAAAPSVPAWCEHWLRAKLGLRGGATPTRVCFVLFCFVLHCVVFLFFVVSNFFLRIEVL